MRETIRNTDGKTIYTLNKDEGVFMIQTYTTMFTSNLTNDGRSIEFSMLDPDDEILMKVYLKKRDAAKLALSILEWCTQ